MKRIVVAMVTTILAVVFALAAAAPAQAYTYKENKVWSWVKAQAPLGASTIGKKQTVQMARLTCNVLDEDYDIYDVIDAITSDTSDMDSDMEDAYFEYAAATVVSGIRYLCPRHAWQLDDL